jgi:hypothetical protein
MKILPRKKLLKKATDAKTRKSKAKAPMIGQVFMLYCH